MNTTTLPWWKQGVIYQIYPRSFMDSDHDGLGDLQGITNRLDYLQDLGVSAIWLSPVYPSPDKDFGYDISDYKDIDPRFGNLSIFDHLIKEAESRSIRIILDMVFNHTSDQHAWFRQSRTSKDNPYREYYLWRPSPGYGKKPNNWKSFFGGDGWELDPKTGEYFFHMFTREQPDLNWRSPVVQREILDVMRFWLDRGVAGFRLDVFNAYFKHKDLTDNPIHFGLRGFDRQYHINDIDQPEMIPFLRKMRQLLDLYGDIYSVGETFLSTPEKASRYIGDDLLHSAFNFKLLECPWDPLKISQSLDEWEKAQKGSSYPCQVLNNHDQSRSTSRYRFPEDDCLTRVAAVLLLSLRGTPFLYYGEEIGMRNVHLKRSQIKDPPGRKYWPFYKGRDGFRSPMQWNGTKYAGFSQTEPWLPINPDYPMRNVETQVKDPSSLFQTYKEMIHLRKVEPLLIEGDFKVVHVFRNILLFTRSLEKETILVMLNFTEESVTVREKPAILNKPSRILFSTTEKNGSGSETYTLGPAEATILKIDNVE